MIDANPPSEVEGVQTKECDLNYKWPIGEEEINVLFALEVIEHVENTRFFMREVERVLESTGVAFLSTPNNESLFSRLTFLLKGEHRYFREAHYPAHINPILTKEMGRVCREVGLAVDKIYYSGVDVMPKLRTKISVGGRLFSKNVGFLIRK